MDGRRLRDRDRNRDRDRGRIAVVFVFERVAFALPTCHRRRRRCYRRAFCSATFLAERARARYRRADGEDSNDIARSGEATIFFFI